MTDCEHYLDGAWCRGATSARSMNPADATPVATFADGGAAEADAGIEAARSMFDRSTWAHEPRRRAAALLDLAQRLESAGPEIARLLTAENGKPLRDAEHEVMLGATELRFYAGLARTLFGRAMEVEPGQWSLIAREPMGVAAIVVPWNAPVILLMRSLAPALAAGCTVVIKGAPQTAGTTARVIRAFAESPLLPRGVLNYFTETGHDGARALVASPDVDVVSYTGSTHVGKQIMAVAAGTLKRLNLELGGSAPCIVFDDADLAAAADELVRAGTFLAGQQCVAASRLLVHANVAADFEREVALRLRALPVGPGSDPRSRMGPLIDRASCDRVTRLYERWSAFGDPVVPLTRPDRVPEGGSFLRPALVRIGRAASFGVEEVFGPLLTLREFDDESAAVVLANEGRLGLAASVWTRDLARAQRVAQALRCGVVWVNAHGRLIPEAEAGGYRESGFGRLHGVHAVDEFLQTKHVAWNVGDA